MKRFFLIALALQLISAQIAFAQTNSIWQNTDGNWSDGGNWSAGVPNGQFNAYLTGNSQTVIQDTIDLQLMGLTIDAGTANVVLDETITVNNTLNFQDGIISGSNDLILASGAIGDFGAGASFDGNLANGGGTLRILGYANINDSFNINGFSELSVSGSIQGAGNLFVNNAFDWNGGTMTGTGTTHFTAGSLIFDGTLDRTINNSGQSTIAGLGLTATTSAAWNNTGNDSFFKITGDQNLRGNGTFNNLDNGLFKKTGGDGTSVVEWDMNHHGQMILVESGTLSFQANTLINGQMTVGSGATIDFRGNTSFGENASHSGDGAMSFTGGVASFGHAYNGHFDTVVANGTILTGTGDISFHRDFVVSTGSILGTGQFNLYGNSEFSIATLRRSVNNFGSSSLTNGLVTGISANWDNRDGSILSFAGFNNAFTGTGQFTNHSSADVVALNGNSWFDWDVANSGNITITSNSSLSFRGHFEQTTSGSITLDNATIEFTDDTSALAGQLAGNGTIVSSNALIVSGNIAPGNGIDALHFVGNIEFTEDASFEFEIGPGSAADLITVMGDLIIDGDISIQSIGNVELGEYTLFSYDGNLFDSGLSLALLPSHLTGELFHNSRDRTIGLNITSIPEPTSTAFLLVASAFFLRRKR